MAFEADDNCNPALTTGNSRDPADEKRQCWKLSCLHFWKTQRMPCSLSLNTVKFATGTNQPSNSSDTPRPRQRGKLVSIFCTELVHWAQRSVISIAAFWIVLAKSPQSLISIS